MESEISNQSKLLMQLKTFASGMFLIDVSSKRFEGLPFELKKLEKNSLNMLKIEKMSFIFSKFDENLEKDLKSFLDQLYSTQIN